jgi:outer membrane protein assembly factor BamB
MLRHCFLSILALTFALTIAAAADWPQWRGPSRDGISKDTGLLKEWPKEGPALRWKATHIGPGYSSPVVVDGKVFLQTTRDQEEFALCLDEKKGNRLWESKAIGVVGKNRGPNYPGTRSTPTIDGELMYCLSSAGQLTCLLTQTGKEKWQKDLAKDFGGVVGTPMMSWAYSESVLVDGDAVVCTPGGSEATLLALNKKSGEVIWKAPIQDADPADYASIMPFEAGGVKQYIQFTRKGLVAVDAKTGKFLWRYNKTSDMGANILTPVVYQDKVFSAGSRSGGATLEVTGGGGKVNAKELYFDKRLGASIGGAVLVDGYLYGSTTQGLFCVDFMTGKEKWTEKSTGNASICYADGCLYVRSHQSGDVFLVEANPKEYVEKGRLKQPERSKTPAWPHPVVANGGLYLRDMDTLCCFDVAKK